MDETAYFVYTNVFLDKNLCLLPMRISFHEIAQISKCQKILQSSTKRFKLSCLDIDATMLYMFVVRNSLRLGIGWKF